MADRNILHEFIAFLIIISFFIVSIAVFSNTQPQEKTGMAVASPMQISMQMNGQETGTPEVMAPAIVWVRTNDRHYLYFDPADGYEWHLSSQGTNEYYLTKNGANPNVATLPGLIFHHNAKTYSPGTAGSLEEVLIGSQGSSTNVGEYDLADNDNLGFNTLYVWSRDGVSPTTYRASISFDNLQFSWGDGTPATSIVEWTLTGQPETARRGFVQTFQFEDPGIYSITLSITNAVGEKQSVSKDVRILPDTREKVFIGPDGEFPTLTAALQSKSNTANLHYKVQTDNTYNEGPLSFRGANTIIGPWGVGKSPELVFMEKGQAVALQAEGVIFRGLTVNRPYNSLASPAPVLAIWNNKMVTIGGERKEDWVFIKGEYSYGVSGGAGKHFLIQNLKNIELDPTGFEGGSAYMVYYGSQTNPGSNQKTSDKQFVIKDLDNGLHTLFMPPHETQLRGDGDYVTIENCNLNSGTLRNGVDADFLSRVQNTFSDKFPIGQDKINFLMKEDLIPYKSNPRNMGSSYYYLGGNTFMIGGLGLNTPPSGAQHMYHTKIEKNLWLGSTIGAAIAGSIDKPYQIGDLVIVNNIFDWRKFFNIRYPASTWHVAIKLQGFKYSNTEPNYLAHNTIISYGTETQDAQTVFAGIPLGTKNHDGPSWIISNNLGVSPYELALGDSTSTGRFWYLQNGGDSCEEVLIQANNNVVWIPSGRESGYLKPNKIFSCNYPAYSFATANTWNYMSGNKEYTVEVDGLYEPTDKSHITIGDYVPGVLEDFWGNTISINANNLVAGAVQIAPVFQCSDGSDNDGDGATDFPNDQDCTSAQDNDESPDPVCGNGKIERGEQCDDLNTNPVNWRTNDWCSPTCRIGLPLREKFYIDDYTQDIDTNPNILQVSAVEWDGSEKYIPLYDSNPVVPTNGLVMLQKFDTDNSFPDSSTNGNIGTCTGDSCPTYTLKGKIGGAYDFDGINDRVRITENTNLDGFSQMSIFTWIKQEGITNSGYWRIYDRDANYATELLFHGHGNPNNNIFYNVKNDLGTRQQFSKYSINMPINQWHHVGFTYDSNTGQLKGYLNGNLIKSISISNNVIDISNTVQAHVGAGRGGWYYNGLIDHMSIHNRVLSQTEITQLIENTKVVTNSYFESNEISAPNLKELVVDWEGTTNQLAVEVSVDDGVTWVSVIKAQSIKISGDSIKYRVTINGPGPVDIDSISLTRVERPPQGAECSNGNTRSCGVTNIGVCSYGLQTCVNELWGTCSGSINPVTEVCNDGLDNDCDGQTDENCGPVCGNGILEINEECDDGNKIDNDRCNNLCQSTTNCEFIATKMNLDLKQRNRVKLFDLCNIPDKTNFKPRFFMKNARIEFDTAWNIENVQGKINLDNGFVPREDGTGFLLDSNLLNYDVSDKAATMTLTGLSFTTPLFRKDGVSCVEPDCVMVSYSGGTLVGRVLGFSEYTIVEGYQPPSPPPSGGGGGGSSGGGGGGGSIAKEISIVDIWSNKLFSKFDKPYFNYNNVQYRIFLDSFNENEMEITFQSPTQVVKLQKGIYKKIDLDRDGKYDLNINYQGMDSYKASVDFRWDPSINEVGIVTKPVEEIKVDQPTQESKDKLIPIVLPEDLDEIEEKSGKTYKGILVGLIVFSFFLIALVFLRKKIPRVIAHWYFAFHHKKHHENVMTAYINSMRKHGHSDQMIREQLMSVGWKNNAIDNLLKK